MSHTPTPWSYDGGKSPWILGPVGDEADRCLIARTNLIPLNPDCRAEVGCGSIDPAANGEFIVRACNAYHDLLDGCYSAVGALRTIEGDHPWAAGIKQAIMDAIRKHTTPPCKATEGVPS